MTGTSEANESMDFADVLTDEAAERRFDEPPDVDHVIMALLADLPALTMPDDVAAQMNWTTPQPDAIAAPPQVSAPVDELATRRRRWPLVLGIAAAVALVVAAGSFIVRGNSAPTVTASVGPVVATGTAYSSATFDGDLAALLATTGTPTTPSTQRLVPLAPQSLKGTFAATPDGISSCVAGFSTAPSVDVVAVDLATFEGQPAAVVVTTPHGTTALEATVVAPTCSASSPQVLAHHTVATP